MKKELSHMTKKSKAVAVTALMLGVAAIGGGLAHADVTATTSAASTGTVATTGTNYGHNPMSSIVTAISTKFGLNTTDVQSVVDNVMTTEHAAMEAQQKQGSASRLAAAVTAGTITQAQADLIMAKTAELEAAREASRTTDVSLTQAERQAKMQAEQASLTEWATANNIPEDFMHLIGGKGHGGGFGGPNGQDGINPGQVPTTLATTTQ